MGFGVECEIGSLDVRSDLGGGAEQRGRDSLLLDRALLCYTMLCYATLVHASLSKVLKDCTALFVSFVLGSAELKV